MSDNNKERKLPDKDYFHNYKGDPEKKKHQREITETQKLEFAEAFNDEEDDVKAYTPAPKKKPSEAPAQTVRIPDEELYAVPEFDSEEFFNTLTLKLKGEKSGESEADDKTVAFSTKEIDEVQQKAEKTTRAEDKKALSDTLGNTRYFNLRQKKKKTAQDKSRKNFMQNFRVLSKDREDRAILEAAPTGKGGKGLADSVKPGKGEDIFEAVEKACIDKSDEARDKNDKLLIRKEREQQGILKGEELKKQLSVELEKNRRCMIICGVLFAVSLVLTLFFRGFSFYGYASLLISLIGCAMCFPAFIKSFKAIRDLAAVSDTALAVMSFFVLIHNIALLGLEQTSSAYTLCVIFACLLRVCSDYFRLMGRSRFVSMALKSKSLSILQRIPVRNDAASFAKNVSKDDKSDIFYCADAYLDTSLDEPGNEGIKENKYYIFSMSLVLLASLIVGLICFVTELSGLSFISALTATVCMLIPVMYDPLSRILFYRNGKEMLKQGACISGREALEHISSSDGFVLDARDVFAGEVSRFRKSAISNIAQTDSAVFAALLLREAGSVLAPCFDEFLEQMNITLPPVENLLYEERQGYSAWVLDRKILVGNRQMLLNHSISVPSKEQEKAYGKGRYVMYVVIDGEISATFLVNYKVLSSLRKYSRDFNKTGLVLMLSSKEAFLDEEIVAAKFSLDASSVKVLSSRAGAVMEKYNSLENQSPTGLICSRKKRSIMHLIMGCYNSNACDRFILTMMLLGQVLGFILLVLSPILKMPVFLNPVAIVFLRLLWGAVTSFVTERKK